MKRICQRCNVISQHFNLWCQENKEPAAHDFTSPAAELTLVKEANERCGGHFNDSISQGQQTTYWWFLVIDENGIRTFYYEPGKYNYLARDFSCGVIPQ